MSTQQFGGWLKHAREARGLSVETVAFQTKIPSRHLQALERGDRLPLPMFYQRAEVRAVARAVGIDEQLAVSRLNAELAPAEPPPPPAPPTPTYLRAPYAAAIIGAVALGVGLIGWSSIGRTAAREDVVKQPQPATAATAPVAEPAHITREVPQAAATATVATVQEAPATPASTTALVIQTQPEGARVTVNGISWGASPVSIRHLEPGAKRIRVTMDGYATSERSVSVDEGGSATVRIRLSSAGS